MSGGRASVWRARLSGLAKLTTVLAVVVVFGVSSMALTAIGVDYSGPGGNPLFKLHPSSWLFALALLFTLLSKPTPSGYLMELPRLFPGATLFAVMWVCILAHATLFQHTPAAPLIDTFFASLAFLPLYRELDQNTLARLKLLLHAIMIVNASLGILEYLLHFRLTPFIVEGEVIDDDYRSTALLGHPLLNASTTAAYILMLFFGGDPKLPAAPRAAVVALQMIAMIAFGGRTAIVLGAGVIVLGCLPKIAALLNGKRFDERLGIVVAIGLPIVIVAIVLAVSQGLLSDLAARFIDDKGSSEARVVIFELFDKFSLEDLLFGPDQDRLLSLQTTLGIEYGVENSWVGFVFQYGLLISALFVTGMLALLTEYIRPSRPGSSIIVVFFLMLSSSSASLSVKSTVMTQFTILLMTIFGREINHAAVKQASIPVRRDPQLIY